MFLATPSQNNNGSSSKLRGSRRFGTYFSKTMAKRIHGRAENENAKEWSEEPRARAAVCNRSDLDLCRQDIRLRVECAGRQYRRLYHGYEHRRAHADWQGRGQQTGHADDSEPERKAPLRRGPLAAAARIDLRHRFRNRRAHAESV